MPWNRWRHRGGGGADRRLTIDHPSTLTIQTLGGFRLWREGRAIPESAWGRDKALQLFQFLVTARARTTHLHKEQIVDTLWPELDPATGDRDFRVALNAIYRVLEPDREARSDSRFVHRQGLVYRLERSRMAVDADAFESLVSRANRALPQESAIEWYQQALTLYEGDYLPERRYEDWSSAERERLQLLSLGARTTLARLLLPRSPLESIRLAQHVLAIDPVWEEAYRVEMEGYLVQGNRPLAIRTYRRCVEALQRELGIDPLPETMRLYRQMVGGVATERPGREEPTAETQRPQRERRERTEKNS